MRWPYSWPIAGTSDSETERTDLGARIHDGQCTCEYPALRDPALGELHALERLVHDLLEVAHDGRRLRGLVCRALLERAGAWELLGDLSGWC